MLNRHSNPRPHIEPRCPKCGSLTVIDNTWEHGKRVDTWRCPLCGHNGESSGFYDARKKDTVAMNRRRP